MHVFWPGVVSIFVMYALIFVVGVWASKGRTTSTNDGTLDELMLAGRNLPLGLGLLSMTATWVGGGYINGTAQTTYQYGLTWGLQAPIGYSLSLILGGMFFARIMRRMRYATLIDPLQIRFGRGVSLLLTLAAVASELIWSAAILVALGSTFATVVGLDFTTSLAVSAAVAIGYTITGGLWSVAWTDAVQLFLIAIGLVVALPYAVHTAGGWLPIREAAQTTSGVIGFAGAHEGVSYLDWLLLLILGGIPWNIYFQRVLATPNETVGARLSIGGGILCMLMAIPPLILGLAARATDWTQVTGGPAGMGMEGGAARVMQTLIDNPSEVLPLQLRLAVPGWVGVVGLGAVAAAVMSSCDSSILSATSMAAWNGWKRLVRPHATAHEMVWLMRGLIVFIGIVATVIGLAVPSVTALWYLCGDVVYIVLFPALVLALFDQKANRLGTMTGIVVASVLRIGGGEPSLSIPQTLPYPVWVEGGMVAFPFRTMAMVAGLVAAIAVSRVTSTIDRPVPLVSGDDPNAMTKGWDGVDIGLWIAGIGAMLATAGLVWSWVAALPGIAAVVVGIVLVGRDLAAPKPATG
jgi:high affinity choline transporter 7